MIQRLQILLALAFATASAFPGDADKNTVEDLTNSFLEAVTSKDEEKFKDFFDKDSFLSFQSELPFGGNFKGKDGAELMYARFLRSFKEIDPEVIASKVNEAKGIALVKMLNRVTFAHNDKEAEIALLNIFEWNQATGKIINFIMVDTDIEATMEDYHTDAEKNLEEMMDLYFKSEYDDIVDKSSPLWDKVADDIKFKIHVYPSDLLDSGKTEWDGKDEAVDAFKEMSELHAKSPLLDIIKQKLHKFKKNVFYSDDKNVWGSVEFGDHLHAIVHYQFNDDDELSWEEIYMAGPTKPWLVYPFPMPVTEKQVNALQEREDKKQRKGKGKFDDEDKKERKFGKKSKDDEDEEDDEDKYKKQRKFGKKSKDDEDDVDDEDKYKKQRKFGKKFEDDEDDDDDEDKYKKQRKSKNPPWEYQESDEDDEDRKKKPRKFRKFDDDDDDDDDYFRKQYENLKDKKKRNKDKDKYGSDDDKKKRKKDKYDDDDDKKKRKKDKYDGDKKKGKKDRYGDKKKRTKNKYDDDKKKGKKDRKKDRYGDDEKKDRKKRRSNRKNVEPMDDDEEFFTGERNTRRRDRDDEDDTDEEEDEALAQERVEKLKELQEAIQDLNQDQRDQGQQEPREGRSMGYYRP